MMDLIRRPMTGSPIKIMVRFLYLYNIRSVFTEILNMVAVGSHHVAQDKREVDGEQAENIGK